MEKAQKRVFITGATGVMGLATVREFVRSGQKVHLTLLARPSKANRCKLSPYITLDNIDVLWGDMLDADIISRGVQQADIVLHIGGMVSPQADYYPLKTFRVNTQSMQRIVDAVKSFPDPASVAVVYIGSVSQYGPAMPPYHWHVAGDTLRPAKGDAYACSKIAAERILTDSGLPKWVSLRQTAILSPALFNKAFDPITFHVPLRGALEWVTADDSARLMVGLCTGDLPEKFFCRFYNIGGGEQYRFSNYEFEERLLRALRMPSPRKIFDAQWFASRNFHGVWFGDSDVLQRLIPFREDTDPDEYFRRMGRSMPWYYRLAPLCPAFIMKWVMRYVAGRNDLAPLYWRKHNITSRIHNHFGSLQEWDAQPGWNTLDITPPSHEYQPQPRCYTGTGSDICKADLEAAARFYDGKCIDSAKYDSDILKPMQWETAEGVRFTASAASVLLGGHWGRPLTPDDFTPE